VSLASNFDRFDNEKFTVVPQSKERGVDRLVSSSIAPASGSPTTLIYRMRQSGGQWRIIDVIFQRRQSAFAATLGSRSGGRDRRHCRAWSPS